MFYLRLLNISNVQILDKEWVCLLLLNAVIHSLAKFARTTSDTTQVPRPQNTNSYWSEMGEWNNEAHTCINTYGEAVISAGTQSVKIPDTHGKASAPPHVCTHKNKGRFSGKKQKFGFTTTWCDLHEGKLLIMKRETEND